MWAVICLLTNEQESHVTRCLIIFMLWVLFQSCFRSETCAQRCCFGPDIHLISYQRERVSNKSSRRASLQGLSPERERNYERKIFDFVLASALSGENLLILDCTLRILHLTHLFNCRLKWLAIFKGDWGV